MAGTTFFDPAAAGLPIRWAGGMVSYWVDQGPLNATIGNDQAVAMVDAAAALWNAVPTAAVSLKRQGWLNEDVSGTNAVAGRMTLTAPSDVAATAVGYSLAVVFDADGAVLDSVVGPGTSDVTNCVRNGVVVWTDDLRTDATVSHAVMLVNGQCATTPELAAMLQFQLERGFGLVLGLGGLAGQS